MSIGCRKGDVASSRGPTAPGKSPIDSEIPPTSPGASSRLKAGEETSVAFRSAKAAFFRGAKGDIPTVIASSVLSVSLLIGSAIVLLGLLWWFDPAKAHLPMCTFHVLTGLDCPGCGATRATHELLHGRLLAAWRYNALWVLMLPVVVYSAVSELRALAGRRALPGDLPRQPWFWVAVVAAAMAFFVVRNLPWSHLCESLHFW
jgi:hypothetical protein